MQDIIKKDDLNYKSKRGKTYNFSKYSLPTVSLRDIHKGHLSIEGPDNKQSNFANELKNFEKGIKGLEKKFIINNLSDAYFIFYLLWFRILISKEYFNIQKFRIKSF